AFFSFEPPSTTTSIHYDPFDYLGNILPQLNVTRHSGTCWIFSIEDPRRNAWRCRSGNYIYDPCFSNSSIAKSVICVVAPLDTHVVELVIDRLPRLESFKFRISPHPWAIELDNSVRCIFEPGGTGSTAAGRLNFLCEDKVTQIFSINMSKGV